MKFSLIALSDERNIPFAELIANRQRMTRPVPTGVISNPAQLPGFQSPAVNPFLQNLRLLQVGCTQPCVPIWLTGSGGFGQITLINRKQAALGQ